MISKYIKKLLVSDFILIYLYKNKAFNIDNTKPVNMIFSNDLKYLLEESYIKKSCGQYYLDTSGINIVFIILDNYYSIKDEAFKVETVVRNNEFVKENIEMDILRRNECLCINCASIKECTTSKKFYDICCEKNIALMVTRCPDFLV